MDFHNNGSNEWLGFRLELLGSFILCVSALFLILLPSNVIRPGILSNFFLLLDRFIRIKCPNLTLDYAENVGLTLSYGLSLNSVLFWAIYMSCFVENRMVSVERVKQFTNIASEAEWKIMDRLPPQNWPTQGNIHLIDLQVNIRFCSYFFLMHFKIILICNFENFHQLTCHSVKCFPTNFSI